MHAGIVSMVTNKVKFMKICVLDLKNTVLYSDALPLSIYMYIHMFFILIVY